MVKNRCMQAPPVPEKLKLLEEGIIEAFSMLDKHIKPIINGVSGFQTSLKIYTEGVPCIGLSYWLSVRGNTITHSGHVETLIGDSLYVSNKVFDAFELSAKSFGIRTMKAEDPQCYENDPAELNVHQRLFWASRNYTWQSAVQLPNEANHPGEVPGYWVKQL